MQRVLLALTIAAPICLSYGIHSVVARLDQATRSQCATHDWPTHQAAAHLEFCRTYLAGR